MKKTAGIVSFFLIVSIAWAQAPKKISIFDAHTLMINCDSTLTGWGRQFNGTLGTAGDTAGMIRIPAYHGGGYSAIQPRSVGIGIDKVVKVAAGAAFSLALKSDGTVWAWGQLGLLGDSSQWSYNMGRDIPKKINALSNVIDIAAGTNHALALLADGTIWAWGSNGYGQLGAKTYRIGTNLPEFYGAIPVKVNHIHNAVAISAGELYSAAILADSTVMVWGRNEYGQLALHDSIEQSIDPLLIDTLHHIVAIDAGPRHFLALTANGTVWAWGYNYWGQVGNGTSTVEDHSPFIERKPSKVKNLANVIAIAAGSSHSMALIKGGTLMTWGRNFYGELGLGTHAFGQENKPFAQGKKYPQQVLLSGVVEIEAGAYSGVAILCDGSMVNWGWNTLGTLGNGNYSSTELPPQQGVGLVPLLQNKPGFVNAQRSLCTNPLDTIVVLGLPKDTTLTTSINSCDVFYNWKKPVAAPCVKVDSTHHASGETFSPGATTVNYAFSNHLGDTVFHSFTVTVMPLLPIAGFEQQYNNQSVSFMDTSSFANAWMWDFGDGNGSTEQNPVHAYTADGIYDVCLIAKNGCTTDTVCDKATIIGTGLLNASSDAIVAAYFNAASNAIVIEHQTHNEMVYLNILAGNGQTLANHIPFQHKISFDTTALSAGVYFVRITDGQGRQRYIQKISVSK